MSAPTVHPETARRESLLEAVSDDTLVALVERGDHDDRRAARAEMFRRGVMPFTTGARVKRLAPPAGSLGTVIGLGGDREFPVRVKYDNGGVESCSPDELEVLPANVIAFDRAEGQGRR